MPIPLAKMIRSPKRSTSRPPPRADTKRINANALTTAPTAVSLTPNESANSGIAGMTTPKPTATATATAVRTPTSRGRSANGFVTGRRGDCAQPSQPPHEQVRRGIAGDLGGLAGAAHKDALGATRHGDDLSRQRAHPTKHR